MKALIKYIRIGVSAGVLFLWMWLFYFIRYSHHPEKYPIKKRYFHVRRTAIKILRIFRTDFKLENLEEYRKVVDSGKGVLVAENHLSIYDVLCLIAITDRPMIFVAKKELAKTPVLGTTVKSIGVLFLDRDDPRQAIKVLNESADYLKNGGIVAVYPEGTRNKKPEEKPLGDFHAGSYKCALRAKADLASFANYGTQHFIEKKSNYRANPVFLKMVSYHEFSEFEKKSTAELAEMSRNEIAAEYENFKEKDKAFVAEGKHKKKPACKWWKDPFFREVK